VSRDRLSRVFWVGAAAILVVAALVALGAIVRGDFSDTDGRILGTLAALLLASGTLISGLMLMEREGALLGRIAIVVSPVGFALLAYAIWDFVFDGGGDEWKYGWLGALMLVAGLIAVTARLLADSRALAPLAVAAGVLASAAAVLSAYAIWEDGSDLIGKALAVLWVLTALCYFLIPVLERYRSESRNGDVRVLASLDGVELVLTRSRAGIQVQLAPGERLELRRRR
jgi:hypothetical protein